MPLSIGDKLGSYEILAAIGAGGMGEVYRARDTRLGRDVALKILGSSLASDAGYLSRFQREAQMLAALNHPNIAQIYGVENQAIIMELVEGHTLQGPLPIPEAIVIARQIAIALEAAHEKGIIHRDLKPGNVKITPDGAVKVLDFGLAKAIESVGGDTANSPTITIHSTQAGAILGTAAYMAPEQARGHAADRRADIWAFGAVLYEMLTGQKAFSGDSVTDILAAVVKLEPDWNALPPATPENLRTLLRRCLTKDRKQRLQAIGEARIVLDQPATEAPPPPATPRSYRALAALALLALAVAVWAAWRFSRPASQPLVQWTVQPGPEFVPTRNDAAVILSPDSTRIVYRGIGPDGRARLYTRLLEQEQTSALNGTEGAQDPFFSPAGDAVGFFASGKLRTVQLRGEGTVALCDAPLPQGGSWGEDGNIVVALASSGVLSRIPAGGGKPQPLTELRHELTHRWPQVLPGARAVIFTAHTSGLAFDDATIEVQSLRSGERKTLVRGGTFGRYAPSGHLLYVRQGVLFAAPMNLPALELTGPAVPLLEGVAASNYGQAQFDLSPNGTLLYRKAGDTKRTLLWLDPSGTTSPLRPAAADYSSIGPFSPDGKRLALVITEAGNPDVWTYDWQRDVMTRLTFTSGLDAFPRWSPDGKYIEFSSVRHGGAQNLYWMPADGAGEAVRLTQSEAVQVPGPVSPDGKHLVFTQIDPQTGYDLWMLPLEGAATAHPQAGTPQPFLQTPFNEGSPAISPDGRWLAYSSNEAGENDVFVRRFPGPGGKWRVSAGGGDIPVWAPRQQELLYQSPEGIMAVSYTAGAADFNASRPRLWVARRGMRGFALNPDGKRLAIAAAESSGKPEMSPIVLLSGFLDHLRRRAPAQ